MSVEDNNEAAAPVSAAPDAETTPDEQLLSQGAEALVYKSSLDGRTAVRKHRPSKSYRLPILDKRLTKQRITAEAKLLQLCKDAKIDVPELYRADTRRGDLWMEFVTGSSVKEVLRAIERGEEELKVDKIEVMRGIGATVARLHMSGLVHGDLTTSNLLLRESGSICVIDFGLGNRVKYPKSGEERAVDLYVLERAFISTHPNAADLFQVVLDSYVEAFEKQGESELIKAVMKRLEVVRMRGRKRSMVG